MHGTQSRLEPVKMAITIPGSGTTTGARLFDLIGNIGRAYRHVRISAYQPAVATERAAFLVASPRPGAEIQATDFSTHGELVAAGEEWSDPSDAAKYLSVRSTTADAVLAHVTII